MGYDVWLDLCGKGRRPAKDAEEDAEPRERPPMFPTVYTHAMYFYIYIHILSIIYVCMLVYAHMYTDAFNYVLIPIYIYIYL